MVEGEGERGSSREGGSRIGGEERESEREWRRGRGGEGEIHRKMYYSGTLVHLWYSTTEVPRYIRVHLGTFGFIRHLKIHKSTQTEYMCGISEYNRVQSSIFMWYIWSEKD